MTDYAKRIDELWESLQSLDVDDEGWVADATKQLEETFSIARGLLKERDALALDVYYSHKKVLSSNRINVVCDCCVCEDVMPPVIPPARAIGGSKRPDSNGN
ncbi:hypothetical protein LCGC14_2132460 [marine sediment metagenome]|uniref:Uncharacterized protein n=1 Tax=marine sediment metagenome TaxID=412755 RepID=A0A0F9EN53_9ZZZZ